jgi:hypothetical protein
MWRSDVTSFFKLRRSGYPNRDYPSSIALVAQIWLRPRKLRPVSNRRCQHSCIPHGDLRGVEEAHLLHLLSSRQAPASMSVHGYDCAVATSDQYIRPSPAAEIRGGLAVIVPSHAQGSSTCMLHVLAAPCSGFCTRVSATLLLGPVAEPAGKDCATRIFLDGNSRIGAPSVPDLPAPQRRCPRHGEPLRIPPHDLPRKLQHIPGEALVQQDTEPGIFGRGIAPGAGTCAFHQALPRPPLPRIFPVDAHSGSKRGDVEGQICAMSSVAC